MYLSIPGLLRNKAGICRNGKEHLKKLVRNRSAMIGLIFIVVLLLMGILQTS